MMMGDTDTKVLLCFVLLGAIFGSTKANVCQCPRNFHQVCGDDGSENGKTYMNNCLAVCDNVLIKCDGACPCQQAREEPTAVRVKNTNCRCPRMMMRVCGDNNKNYFNDCLAECDGARVECRGQCPCSQKLIDPREPILIVDPKEPAPRTTAAPDMQDVWQRLIDYIRNLRKLNF